MMKATLINFQPNVIVGIRHTVGEDLLVLQIKSNTGCLKVLTFTQKEAMDFLPFLIQARNETAEYGELGDGACGNEKATIIWRGPWLNIRQSKPMIQHGLLNAVYSVPNPTFHNTVLSDLVEVFSLYLRGSHDFSSFSKETEREKIAVFHEKAESDQHPKVWTEEGIVATFLMFKGKREYVSLGLSTRQGQVSFTFCPEFQLRELETALDRALTGETFVTTETGKNGCARSCFIYHSINQNGNGNNVLRITHSVRTHGTSIGIIITPESVKFLKGVIQKAREMYS